MKRILNTMALVGIAGILATSHTATAGREIQRAGNVVRLEALMDSPNSGEKAKSRYEERQRTYYGVPQSMQQRFRVEVQNFNPGEELTIVLNGDMIGTITANELGRAELQFRTAAFIDDPSDGFPLGDFPPIHVGDTISVGPLTGTFAER